MCLIYGAPTRAARTGSFSLIYMGDVDHAFASNGPKHINNLSELWTTFFIFKKQMHQ